ncbi:hypothetical protein Tco_1317422 [Tanacetum coccineum]
MPIGSDFGPALDPLIHSTTIIVEVPKELHYNIFDNFNRYLVEELADVQKVFYQMEQAVEQHRLESRTFEVKMNQVLSENERLLAQAIDKDIVKTVVNLSVNASDENVPECQKCLELETELVKKKDFVDKETYDNLCKCFTTLEKHCITLEADSQLNQEIFQQENSVLNQNAPSFTQLFELSELKAQSQAKDTVIVKLKEQIKSFKGNVEDMLADSPLKAIQKKDRILQAPSSNSKNKVEAHPRNVKSSLNKRIVLICMSSDNVCVLNAVNVVKSCAKLTRINLKRYLENNRKGVLSYRIYWRLRKPIVLDSESPKPVVKLVYSRKPRKNKNAESVSNTKVVQIVLWYLDSGCSKHMTGDRSQLTNFVSKFLGTVKFGNDQVAKIMGFGDYQIGNVTISRVYYVEGLGHNLFSVGQFCDSNLEVAFRQHTCFIRNLEGVDLLTDLRAIPYTLSLGIYMDLSRSLNSSLEKDTYVSACAIRQKVQRNPTNPNLKTPIKKKLYCCMYGSMWGQCVSRVSVE